MFNIIFHNMWIYVQVSRIHPDLSASLFAMDIYIGWTECDEEAEVARDSKWCIEGEFIGLAAHTNATFMLSNMTLQI